MRGNDSLTCPFDRQGVGIRVGYQEITLHTSRPFNWLILWLEACTAGQIQTGVGWFICSRLLFTQHHSRIPSRRSLILLQSEKYVSAQPKAGLTLQEFQNFKSGCVTHIRRNFTDVLLSNLKHAHTTRFENNRASQATGYY